MSNDSEYFFLPSIKPSQKLKSVKRRLKNSRGTRTSQMINHHPCTSIIAILELICHRMIDDAMKIS